MLYNVEYENLTVELSGFVYFYENVTQLEIQTTSAILEVLSVLECPEVFVALAPQMNEHRWCLNNIQLMVLTCL